MFVAKRRALTLVELIVVVAVLVVIVVVLLAANGRSGFDRAVMRRLKDSSQVRGGVQAITTWTGVNQDRFPLPSELDKDNETLAIDPLCKDTTANLMSVLVYNSFVMTEGCINPADANGNVQEKSDYQFNAPVAAVTPDKALWDPSFSADFTASTPGNVSYATMAMSPARLEHYQKDRFNAALPLLGDRGPELTVSKGKSPQVNAAMTNTGSLTLLIHGARTSWEGNIGYADGHVNFETQFDPDGLEYKDSTGTKWRDVLFVDEADDAAGLNAYLGVFVNKDSGVRGIFD